MPDIYDAVVIGAGHNGLVAACYLARAGKKVLVLERRDAVGGIAATEEFAPGFKGSIGPDFCGLLLPRVVEELELSRHGLELIQLDPLAVGLGADGAPLALWRDREKTREEIARRSASDARAYPAYLDLVETIAGFLRPLMERPAPQPEIRGASDLIELVKLGWGFRRLGAKHMHEALRVLPMAVADFLDEWFEDDLLKAVLAAPGLEGVALGPRSAGTTAILLYHAIGQPACLPRGGAGSIAAALARAAEARGARIRTEAPVARITSREGRVTGVVLDSGEEIAATYVLSSLAPRATFLELTDPGLLDPSFVEEVRNIRYRGVTAKLLLALGELPRFTGIAGAASGPHDRGILHVSPSLDDLDRAYDDAKYGRPSAKPFLRAVIPTLRDPSLAPEGKHVLSVTMQYAPYRLQEGTWRERSEALADSIIETLAAHAPNLKDAILARRILTPADYEERYGLPEGSLHQGELALDQLFFMRPVPGWSEYRTPIENLYLCGSATHPGGGITGACGYNASREVLQRAS